MKDKSSNVGFQLSIDGSTDKGAKAIKLLNISPRRKSELLIIALNELAESYGIEDFTKEELDSFTANFASIKKYLSGVKPINVSIVGASPASPTAPPTPIESQPLQQQKNPADIPNPFAIGNNKSESLNDSDMQFSPSKRQEVKNMLNLFNAQ